MTTVSTELTLPYSSDRTVLAVQDTIDRFQWRVLEMSTTRIVIDLGALNAMHTYNFPKMTVLFKELDGQTRLSISVSLKGDLGTSKKRLTDKWGSSSTACPSVSKRIPSRSIPPWPSVKAKGTRRVQARTESPN